MAATEASGWWQKQVDKFAAVDSGPNVREHYEVSVQV